MWEITCWRIPCLRLHFYTCPLLMPLMCVILWFGDRVGSYWRARGYMSRQAADLALLPAWLWHLASPSLPSARICPMNVTLSFFFFNRREIQVEHLWYLLPFQLITNCDSLKIQDFLVSSIHEISLLMHLTSCTYLSFWMSCSMNFQHFGGLVLAFDFYFWFYINGISATTPKWESQFSQAFWKPSLQCICLSSLV